MSFKIPTDLQYTKSHEWIRIEGDEALVGITDYAQNTLGDVVFVDLKEVGTTLAAEDTFGAVESVKAASDLFLPVDGEIIEVNGEVVETPELINTDTYTDGWLVKIRLSAGSIGALMSADAYQKYIDSLDH